MHEADSPIFETLDDEVEERALAEAEADFAAGRLISHKAVMAWVDSWGKPEEATPPAVGV